jgi:hypothetical protein
MSYHKNLYVHPENQELLWNNINKIPMFQAMGQGIPNYKEQWFKTIIENFYEKYPIVDNKPLLQKINRDTLGYMIEVLKSNMSNTNSRMNIPQKNMGSAGVVPNINGFQEPNYLGKDAEKVQKQELYNQAFGERQKQYEQMFAKPPAPEVNFSEKLDDRPISNMDELIERHRKERETELNKFSPLNKFLPTPTQTNNTPLPPSIVINKQSHPPTPSQVPQQLQSENVRLTISDIPNDTNYLQRLMEEHNALLKSIANDVSDLKQKYDNLLHKIEPPLVIPESSLPTESNPEIEMLEKLKPVDGFVQDMEQN